MTRRLSRTSEVAFQAETHRKRLATMWARYGAQALNGHHDPKIRMYVSPWVTERPSGVKTRFVRQLEKTDA
jgi:hypothetical protein